jgi:hypothetical protein
MDARKDKLDRRLARENFPASEAPVMAGARVRYEMAGRTRGLAWGGLAAMHQMARGLGLDRAINESLSLLKAHMPYHESDHVLNMAYNVLAGGTCLEDIERLRCEESHMDALGAARIPDPTTAGDFLRRFDEASVLALQEAINQARLRAWARQEAAFFERAVIDGDGSFAPTTGECKEGMDISYKGLWGYHPLLITLANTREALYIVNRPGNAASSSGAAEYFDRAVALARKGGFRSILLRGDTDFSQSAHLDRWDGAGDVKFIFGFDACPNLVEMAGNLPKSAWKRLRRKPRYEVKTQERARPENVKERIVRERGYKNFRLLCEHVAEFDYRPTACEKSYRMVVVRKNISVEKGENVLFEEIRYFFYITNEREEAKEEIVFSANERCDQENTIAQLKGQVGALRAPVGDLHANGAYMAIAALAWNLKAWWALMAPEREARRAGLRMEFKRFLNQAIMIPCQIVRSAGRLTLRVIGWHPSLPAFFRTFQAVAALRAP